MAVKHSTPQDDFAARLLILLRCEDAPIHGLEELEAELALQPVVKRPVWATRDYDGIQLNKTGPMDALELGVLIARRYGHHQRVEFMMRRDDGWSPRVMTDRWDDLDIEPLLRPLFTRAAESVVKIAY